MQAFPCFHDGYLDGFFYEEENAVTLLLRDEKKQPFALALQNVLAMRLDDVQPRNILLELTSQSHEAIGEEHVTYLYRLEDACDKQERIAEYLTSAQQKKARLIQVYASYGAVGMILFETMELREGWPLARP